MNGPCDFLVQTFVTICYLQLSMQFILKKELKSSCIPILLIFNRFIWKFGSICSSMIEITKLMNRCNIYIIISV
jgi:hypothetical protein